MMKKYLFSLLLLAGISAVSTAQVKEIPCYTHEAMEEAFQKNPAYRDAVNRAIEKANKKGAMSLSKTGGGDTIFRIPVVFHVVYRLNSENIHDSLIHSQIKILNEHFNRTHADTGKTRHVFKPVAASAKIEFFLATKDPNGGTTTGITRTQTNRTSFVTTLNDFLSQADNIKSSSLGGEDAWDPDNYLNIWVGNITLNNYVFLMGYAYPPADLANWPFGESAPYHEMEGVVIQYSVIGKGNPQNNTPNNNLGRVTIHEVGHYLGLRHIWGDNPSCSADDFIEDTPPMASNSQTNNCNFNKNTCFSDQLPDMIENYMDYSPETCQNMFTKQQANLMRNILRVNRPQLAELIINGADPKVNTGDNKPVDFVVKPNPSVDKKITLMFQGVPQSDFSVEVMDVIGRRVMTQNFTQGSLEYNMNLSILQDGIYYLVSKTEGKSKAVKFMIAGE